MIVTDKELQALSSLSLSLSNGLLSEEDSFSSDYILYISKYSTEEEKARPR